MEQENRTKVAKSSVVPVLVGQAQRTNIWNNI